MSTFSVLMLTLKGKIGYSPKATSTRREATWDQALYAKPGVGGLGFWEQCPLEPKWPSVARYVYILDPPGRGGTL